MRLFYSLCVVLLVAACAPADDSGVGDGGGPNPAPATSGPAATPGAVVPGATREGPEDARPVVVFFGTSLTAGLGLQSEDDTYVAKVRELADGAGVPFHAVNAGVSGETSAAGLRRIEWVLQRPLDILVLELGANDGLRGLDAGALAENLSAIIRRTRARYPDAGIVLIQMEAPPNLGERYITAFRDAFEAVAAAEGVRLAPFLLEGVAAVPELNQSDGIHPTPEGHRRMADNLLPTLLDALEAHARASASQAGAPTPAGAGGAQ